MTGRWYGAPPLKSDELLSSWLVRVALHFGCDPLVLSNLLWPDKRVWTSDIDRFHTEEQLIPVCEALGIEFQVLQQHSLYPIARSLSETLSYKSVWPWVVAIGARNLKRSSGLHYCPNCFAEKSTAYFPIKWRLAWHTSCQKHQVYLHDRCPHCDSSIEPHRLKNVVQNIRLCATCGGQLNEATVKKCDSNLLAFQKEADLVMQHGVAKYAGNTVSSLDWFKTINALVIFYRRISRSQTNDMRVLNHFELEQFKNLTGKNIQTLALRDRQEILKSAFSLFCIEEQELIDGLLLCGVTQHAFIEKGQKVPLPLQSIYQSLPATHQVSRIKKQQKVLQPTPKWLVQNKMQRLERKLALSSSQLSQLKQDQSAMSVAE